MPFDYFPKKTATEWMKSVGLDPDMKPVPIDRENFAYVLERMNNELIVTGFPSVDVAIANNYGPYFVTALDLFNLTNFEDRSAIYEKYIGSSANEKRIFLNNNELLFSQFIIDGLMKMHTTLFKKNDLSFEDVLEGKSWTTPLSPDDPNVLRPITKDTLYSIAFEHHFDPPYQSTDEIYNSFSIVKASPLHKLYEFEEMGCVPYHLKKMIRDGVMVRYKNT